MKTLQEQVFDFAHKELCNEYSEKAGLKPDAIPKMMERIEQIINLVEARDFLFRDFGNVLFLDSDYDSLNMEMIKRILETKFNVQMTNPI